MTIASSRRPGSRRPPSQSTQLEGTQLTFVNPEPERPDKPYELEEDIAAEDADSETVVHEGQRGFRDDATD